MGRKYSINSTGYIVAERDIYSLGGFIPKGSVGAKVANETQIAQEGECWVASGDMSTRPDVIVKDNAYIGKFFTNENPVHTDGSTVFSGNTLIPGHITIRCPQADPKNNVLVKDSFIGVSMDVLCGPASTATAIPFEQGGFNKDVPAGTLFTSASMHTGDANICRTTANLRLGEDTYIYIPTGYNCRILWGYWNAVGQLAYSGESFAVTQALTKLSHPVYRLAMVHISKANGTAMTPANLLDTGAKILGHISGSLLMDFRPESVSGEYVMDNSSFIMPTNNFGLATTQLRFFAGGLYNTNMYTPTDRQDYKPYGTFRNVERLEYTKYLGDSYRTVATRDRAVSAYDCPLLRLDDLAFNDTMIQLGDLTLRRCIVPKGVFRNDAVNGNTYEDIDFSYANEDLGLNIPGYTNFLSSHKEGLYRLDLSGGFTNGLVSHKGNLDSSAKLFPDIEEIPIDGNIIEQGAYLIQAGKYYEETKTTTVDRVRTGRPLPTEGAVLPTVPNGYYITSIVYLNEQFIIQTSQTTPTSIDTGHPYFLLHFGRIGDTALNASDFIALGLLLRRSEYTRFPEITGSAYVGAGCIVRGDAQLHGDPYVNRVLDVNLWEKGSISIPDNGWDAAKNPPGGPTDVDRRRLKEVIRVEPGAKIVCNSGYWINCYFYDANGSYLGSPGWGQIASTAPDNAAFAGVILKKSETASGTGYIEDSDIPLANVKYRRAFKKIRYITNELDRKSPEDILLTPDYWRIASLNTGDAWIGKLYKDLVATSPYWLILKRPINAGVSRSVTFNSAAYGLANSTWDTSTKLVDRLTTTIQALAGLEVKKTGTSIPVELSDVEKARVIVEFTPSPRIVTPYGVSNLWIEKTRLRMYDNAVLSRTITHGQGVILKDNAVMGNVFTGDVCICSNGHSDAIIKLP